MKLLRKFRWILIGGGVAVMILAFLAFRPDKLFIDDVVDESLSEAFAPSSQTTTTTTPPPTIDTTTTTESTGTGTVPTESTTTTTVVSETGEPVVIASGTFRGTGYSAAGTATIYEQDGSFVLRLEDDTVIQNGPDLFVWLLAAPDFDGEDPTEYIDLGKLKGNIGGQNYQLPPEYDPEIHQSVLIWCLRFTTPFAAAALQ